MLYIESPVPRAAHDSGSDDAPRRVRPGVDIAGLVVPWALLRGEISSWSMTLLNFAVRASSSVVISYGPAPDAVTAAICCRIWLTSARPCVLRRTGPRVETTYW